MEALEEVRAFNRYMDGEPNDKFGDLASKVDLKMRARFLRIQGSSTIMNIWRKPENPSSDPSSNPKTIIARGPA